MKVRQPFLVFKEQVLGRFTSERDGDSFLKKLLRIVGSILDDEGRKMYPAAITLRMSPDAWVPIHRPRCYLLICKDKQYLLKVAERVQAGPSLISIGFAPFYLRLATHSS